MNPVRIRLVCSELKYPHGRNFPVSYDDTVTTIVVELCSTFSPIIKCLNLGKIIEIIMAKSQTGIKWATESPQISILYNKKKTK